MKKPIRKRWQFISTMAVLCFAMLAGSCKKIDFEKLHEENIKHIQTYDEAWDMLKETYDLFKGLPAGDDNFYPYMLISTALYSDEALYMGSDPQWAQFADRYIISDNQLCSTIWFTGFKIIDNANILIRDVENFEEENAEQYNIVGQAKAIWAFTHFLLMNLYGNIPLVYDPLLPGYYPEISSKSDLYDAIIEYLNYAVEYLSEYGTSDNTIINVNVAKALLARVYLYDEQWTKAYQTAEDIIMSGAYLLCEDYQDAFLKDHNPEIIWKLDYNTNNKSILGYYAYPADSGGIYMYAPNEDQTYFCDLTDRRRLFSVSWANSDFFITKYRNPTTGDFDIPVIRYPEILLMAAEAALNSGNTTISLVYFNQVRERAKRQSYPSITKEDILREYQCEFAYEGHRWFDINRMGMAQILFSDLTPTKNIWPIPQEALDENPSLHQNPGY